MIIFYKIKEKITLKIKRLIFPFQTILILLVFTVLATVSSQDYSQLFAGFGPYIRQAVAMRDPRSNRGEYANPFNPRNPWNQFPINLDSTNNQFSDPPPRFLDP